VAACDPPTAHATIKLRRLFGGVSGRRLGFVSSQAWARGVCVTNLQHWTITAHATTTPGQATRDSGRQETRLHHSHSLYLMPILPLPLGHLALTASSAGDAPRNHRIRREPQSVVRVGRVRQLE
jgi:hypothetical protein